MNDHHLIKEHSLITDLVSKYVIVFQVASPGRAGPTADALTSF